MRIAKPGSANNSPRSSTLQSRRRTLVGDGFQARPQPQSPAMDQMYMPAPASQTPSEPFYEQQTRPARPLSWHPSSQHAQQWLLPYQDTSFNPTAYPYPTYNDAEILGSLHMPPTPAVYSGYTSPASSFSPLSLPYSNFSSQPMCSPLNQPMPMQQQHQEVPALNNYSAGTLSEIPYLPPPQVTDGSIGWDPYFATSSTIALPNRQTAPPTPEDFAYNPLIHNPENDDASEEGEILYGLGLYDPPDHSKRSVVLSLLGGEQKEVVDTGKGLGLMLEDAWEPAASEDEDEEGDDDDDEEEDDEDDGEAQDD
ncbi:hypothetical protein N0V88_001179 [Collariella sp. IMI 366227]|nr:hypothetical protein N0V88_001179 [Collariella sp. IMI 366227]